MVIFLSMKIWFTRRFNMLRKLKEKLFLLFLLVSILTLTMLNTYLVYQKGDVEEFRTIKHHMSHIMKSYEGAFKLINKENSNLLPPPVFQYRISGKQSKRDMEKEFQKNHTLLLDNIIGKVRQNLRNRLARFPVNIWPSLFPYKNKVNLSIHKTKPRKIETMQLQKCIIPKLDPFHPDVKPFYRKGGKKNCTIKRVGRIVDGRLKAVLTGVEKAGFYYIRRHDEFSNKLSERKDLKLYDGKTIDMIVDIPLDEDYIKFEYTQNGKTTTEFHMHAGKHEARKAITTNQSRTTDTKNNKPNMVMFKPNILMLMVDGLSAANAERQLGETVTWLKNDVHSYRLEGQSVVGDGTTPQLCAMLTGHHEFELPEARRGFKGSKHVDDWPFIFKDFEKIGYKTVYSEDDPFLGSFQFRLHGFKEQPTTKYLRPYWLAIQDMVWQANGNSHSCPHEHALAYLRELLKLYHNEKIFGLFTFSNVGHGEPNRHTLVDNDLATFLREFSASKKRQDTILMIFGDHGSRSGEYRATMQGRLEERLPFFSITFPPKFRELYPKEMKYFDQNVKVLTSFLDIHASFKHLLTFPTNSFNAPFARSLFTDIVSLNRSCEEAGIERHWCPCLDYQTVDIKSGIIRYLSNKVVEHMNNLTNALPHKTNPCHELTLDHVLRADKHIPNKKVQQFKNTHRDSKCDACGVAFDTKFKLKFVTYAITLQVAPSMGKYEASIEYRHEGEEIVRIKEISRINWYGEQPKCIEREYPYLRKFCFCRDHV